MPAQKGRAKVEGLTSLVSKLESKIAASRRDDNVSVVVGYTQSYALFVHEDRQAYHPVGRAGFLLDVAREQADNVSRIVENALISGKTMSQSLLLGGLHIQRESQMNVPVDTGALKASAFTRLEGNKGES